MMINSGSHFNVIRYIVVTIAVAVGGLLYAADDSLAEASVLMKAGETDSAIAMLRRMEKSSPKNGSVNMLLGDCYASVDSVDAAKAEYRKAVKKGENDAWLSFARLAVTDYRINDAMEDVELYRKGLKKGKKTLPDESGDVVAAIEKTRNMLDRVEKIVIIDSLTVDAEDFFTNYKLASEAGAIIPPENLPDKFDWAYPTSVYVSESGNMCMWAAPDSTQTFQLVTSSLLYGGEWEVPMPLEGDLNQGGDANFPFLMPDGITLYFASNGENSLGGYDIFISRRSGTEYLQPQNIGMPYNSPYNDYMLAIDEFTGAGWWATDRNKIEGKVTIYVFIPNDMRVNYDIDDPNLASYAKVERIADTWREGADYTALRESIESIVPQVKRRAEGAFALSVPGYGVYTSLEDFVSDDARREMRRYLSANRAINQAKEKLLQLRGRYAEGETGLADEILAWERRIAGMRQELKSMKNSIIIIETSARQK